jgi:hypothetical protein
MRRTHIALIVVLALAGLTYWVMAADMPEMKSGMMGGMMGGEMKDHMMMGGMCPGHMVVARLMSNSEMVATLDGGVIVMMGTKLMKYDKNLAVVEQTEMKVDVDAMAKRMADMCDKCPMCKKMMEGGMMKGEKTKSSMMKDVETQIAK